MRTSTLALCVWLAVLLSGCGTLIVSDQDRVQAIERDKQALAREPDNWLLHRHLGRLYFDLKDYAQAEQSFREVQQRKPGEPESNLYLGLSLIGKGEREAGLDLLTALRWPGKFYQQKFVQEEARRLQKHPEEPSKEVIHDLLNALYEGTQEQDRLDMDMGMGLGIGGSGGGFWMRW